VLRPNRYNAIYFRAAKGNFVEVRAAVDGGCALLAGLALEA
jgi:hypothetical protein